MLSYRPDFMEGFSCKRGACRRTCCRHDWNVVVTRREYLAAADPALEAGLRGLAEAHLRPNPRSASDDDYGMVEMVGDVGCPMLDGDGLCRWRALAGRHICVTCESFPCTGLLVPGAEYQMPSAGCEEVLELLDGRAEPVRMACEEVPGPGEGDAGEGAGAADERGYYMRVTEEAVARRPLLGHVRELVSLGLGALQDRGRALDERVARLLEGLAQVDLLERTGRVGELPGLLEALSSPQGRPGATGAPGGPAAGAPLALLACGEVFSHYCNGSAHAPTARRILRGLGFELAEVPGEGGGDGEPRVMPRLRSREAYPAARARLDAVLAGHGPLLEHVAVCLYLKTLTPIAGPGVWDDAVHLGALYAAFKGGLAGYFADEAPREGQVVDVLVEMARMATHSELVRPTVCARMSQAGCDGLQAMEALVRA